jgi:hypothetical protein
MNHAKLLAIKKIFKQKVVENFVNLTFCCNFATENKQKDNYN